MSKSVRLKNNIYLDYQSIYKTFDYVQNNSDLDTYTTTGYYLGNQTTGVSNSPVGSTLDGLLVVESVICPFVFSIQTYYGSNGTKYSRIYWFGVYWTGWVQN